MVIEGDDLSINRFGANTLCYLVINNNKDKFILKKILMCGIFIDIQVRFSEDDGLDARSFFFVGDADCSVIQVKISISQEIFQYFPVVVVVGEVFVVLRGYFSYFS